MQHHPDPRLERVLPGLFAELAETPTPAYLEAAIERASSRPQRPAWTFLGRWLPLDTVATAHVPSSRFPIRAVGILALIALLVAGALIITAGQQRQLVPAPLYGPAENGLVAYAVDGDIVVHDPATAETRTIVGGSEVDSGPRFSRDGTRIVFARSVAGDGPLHDVWVANADGSDARAVTTEAMVLSFNSMAAPYTFASDGLTVAITGLAPGDKPAVLVAPVTASGDSRWYEFDDVPGAIKAVREPHFRPKDDGTLLVTIERWDLSPTVYSLDLTAGIATPIVISGSSAGLDGARWSPDGQSISYTTWNEAESGLTVRTHIVNADGTGDRLLTEPEGMVFDIAAAWSNDASRLLVVRGFSADMYDPWSDTRAAIVPADGSSVGLEIPSDEPIQGGCCYSWEWAPDDSQVLGKRIMPNGTTGRQHIVDVASATLSEAPWDVTDDPVWQRLAP